jgi:RimJ/RimL family protein N-acetyltransferase
MLQTRRILLRRWRDSDREPFAALNSDPRVMRFFPALLSREESDALVQRIERDFEKRGFGLFAAELSADRAFIGFIGLSVPDFEAHFTPCVEIGWRLAADCWNQGLATEGAREVLRHAFDSLRLDEIVARTVPANLASRRVMEKIGMTRAPEDDFDHPKLPESHALRRHVLYRIRKA